MTNENQTQFDLIVGSSGQDGFYLQQFLQTQERKYLCLDKDGLFDHDGKLTALNICDQSAASELLQKYPIARIYYLAAFHHSAEQNDANHIETLKKSMDIHVYALDNFINAIIKYCPNCKIFYAASSHLFSGLKDRDEKSKILIDENSAISPKGWYSFSKAAGLELIKSARQNGIFAVAGYLFNHESARRPISFLSSKLTHGAIDAMLGKQDKLELLHVNAKIDWGYAPDYVRAMHLTLEHSAAQDYVIATGKLHSVAEYAEKIYGLVGLDWRDFITVNQAITRKIGDGSALVGNNNRLIKSTGWRPEFDFDNMVAQILLDTAAIRNINLNRKIKEKIKEKIKGTYHASQE